MSPSERTLAAMLCMRSSALCVPETSGIEGSRADGRVQALGELEHKLTGAQGVWFRVHGN